KTKVKQNRKMKCSFSANDSAYRPRWRGACQRQQDARRPSLSAPDSCFCPLLSLHKRAEYLSECGSSCSIDDGGQENHQGLWSIMCSYDVPPKRDVRCPRPQMFRRSVACEPDGQRDVRGRPICHRPHSRRGKATVAWTLQLAFGAQSPSFFFGFLI